MSDFPSWAVMRELMHVSHIFPEGAGVNDKAIFTANVADNTWSDWIEIADNNPITLSSKFAGRAGHISSIQVEDASVNDKVYVLEIAYGADKINVAVHRFISGTTLLPAIQQIRLRPEAIPAGETVYYRLKCETGGSTCQVSFRYHYH